MNDAADLIVKHYERHALSWDADRRAAGWNDKCWIDRFVGLLPYGADVLDLGCGGGEMLKLIAGMGRKANIPMRLTGIDANPHIIEFARQHSSTYPEIDYSTVNLFSEEFSSRKFDIYVATLVVHHFSDEELVGLLRILIRQASRGVVINDIHRHWFAFHSIRWLTRLFSNSSMVKFDAPLSVLRAFTRKELEDLLSKAGISTYHLVWKWAFRWQLIITPV